MPTRALRSPRPALALALLLAAAAPAAVRADYDELAEFKANGAEPYLDFGSSLSLVAPFGAAFAPTPALMAVGAPFQTVPAIQIFTSLDGRTWTFNASLSCCPRGPPAQAGGYFALSFSGAGTRLRGHEFHYSTILDQPDPPLAQVLDAEGNEVAESGSYRGRVTGSYFHLIAEAS